MNVLERKKLKSLSFIVSQFFYVLNKGEHTHTHKGKKNVGQANLNVGGKYFIFFIAKTTVRRMYE